MHAPFVFSSTQPYLPFAIAVFFFLFRVCVEKCSSPNLRWSVPHSTHHWKPSPLQAHWGRWWHSCLLWLACLFTVPLPHSPELRVPCPFCCIPFFVFPAACLLFNLFFSLFFPGWGSVCPWGYADLAQGCLWEYCVPLSSPGGLLLPSRLGAGIWQYESLPGFSI
jgi:hypothetical protein